MLNILLKLGLGLSYIWLALFLLCGIIWLLPALYSWLTRRTRLPDILLARQIQAGCAFVTGCLVLLFYIAHLIWVLPLSSLLVLLRVPDRFIPQRYMVIVCNGTLYHLVYRGMLGMHFTLDKRLINDRQMNPLDFAVVLAVHTSNPEIFPWFYRVPQVLGHNVMFVAAAKHSKHLLGKVWYWLRVIWMIPRSADGDKSVRIIQAGMEDLVTSKPYGQLLGLFPTGTRTDEDRIASSHAYIADQVLQLRDAGEHAEADWLQGQLDRAVDLFPRLRGSQIICQMAPGTSRYFLVGVRSPDRHGTAIFSQYPNLVGRQMDFLIVEIPRPDTADKPFKWLLIEAFVELGRWSAYKNSKFDDINWVPSGNVQ